MLFCSNNCSSPFRLIISHCYINTWLLYFLNYWLIWHLSIHCPWIHIFWCFHTLFIFMDFPIIHFMVILLIFILSFNFFIYLILNICFIIRIILANHLRSINFIQQIFCFRYFLFWLKYSFIFLLFKYILNLLIIRNIFILLLII